MNWHFFFAIISCVSLACSPKTDSKNESVTEPPVENEPTFNSQKFEISFASELSNETLQLAQSFADNQIESVMLISLLPDCQTFDGEEQCYETSVLTTAEGDSLTTDFPANLDKVKVDTDRFGVTKTLAPADIRILLSALFSGQEKQAISFCYVPRHAIAIFAPNSKISGFIELCFECSESIAILQSTEIPDLSRQSLNEIGALFKAHGFEEKPSFNE